MSIFSRIASLFVGNKKDELVEQKNSSESYGSYLNMGIKDVYNESANSKYNTEEDCIESEINDKKDFDYEASWNNNADNVYCKNRDILKGSKFSATLYIRTDLSVLIHHGEIFNGPPSRAPKYGTMADGIWIPLTKSWEELGIKKKNLEESELATDIGPAKASYYLPFLIDFRRIVESECSVNDKISNVKKLCNKSISYKEIFHKLEKSYNNFPESYFYMKIAAIPGIGEKTAQNIFEHGLQTLDQVKNAKDEQLLVINGIGKGTVQKIRTYYESNKRKKIK